jgi:predicted CoA-binding protein
MNSLEAFLKYQTFAVAGASRDRSKYGNIVYRALQKSGRQTFAINPNTDSVEGDLAYAKINDLPRSVEALSVVTPPEVSLLVVQDAIRAGVKSIWFQPGAENKQASRLARQAGIEVIDDGSCILVALAQGV